MNKIDEIWKLLKLISKIEILPMEFVGTMCSKAETRSSSQARFAHVTSESKIADTQ